MENARDTSNHSTQKTPHNESSQQPQSVNKTRIVQRFYSFLGFLLFAMFSSVQANDVSQYGTSLWLTDTWLIGYAILSIICLFNIFRPLPPKIFLILAGVTFALALFRGSQIDWNQPLFCFIPPDDPALRINPAGNETGGLVIMTLWLLLLRWVNKRLLKPSVK